MWRAQQRDVEGWNKLGYFVGGYRAFRSLLLRAETWGRRAYVKSRISNGSALVIRHYVPSCLQHVGMDYLSPGLQVFKYDMFELLFQPVTGLLFSDIHCVI